MIHSSPATPANSSRMRAAVSMPRSPTRISRSRPKRCRTFVRAAVTVFGSPVLPSNTSTATGQPSPFVSTPNTICSLSRFPSRECPNLASGQRRPSKYVEVTS